MGDAFDPYLSHWADVAARRTIAAHPDVDTYVVAAGITPSGVVHVGNFREVMTVDLVARALRDHGKSVRFIYSWDDFDVFRKVPADMPEQAMLTENLRRSIADVPDPFGEHDSYATHNIRAFEDSLKPLGIAPEFIRQSKAYRAGTYAEGIKRALESRDEIAAILNAHRKTPLADDWLPISGFCDSCATTTWPFAGTATTSSATAAAPVATRGRPTCARAATSSCRGASTGPCDGPTSASASSPAARTTPAPAAATRARRS